MAPHTWSYLGDTVSDATRHMYYRGQRIREAYYRGEKIWYSDELSRIFIAKLPNKLHYAPNESIDYEGVKILGVWLSGRTEDVTTDCEFYPPEGMFIDLSEVFLGIVLAQLPNKAAYSAGERLNYDGASILAIYADWHVEDITSECEFYQNSGTLALAPSLIGILVTKLPDKVIYKRGESLNFSGLKVYAAYTNGRLANVTNECVIQKD